MKLRQQKLYGAGIALVIVSIIVIAIFSFYQTRKVNEIGSRIDYARSTLLDLSDLYNLTLAHAGAARNYAMNANADNVREIAATANRLQSQFEGLKKRIKTDFAIKAQLDSIEKYIAKRIEISNELVAEGNAKGPAAAAALYQTGRGRDYNNQIFSFIQQLQSDELTTLEEDEKSSAGSIGKLNLYLLGLLGFILVLVVILVQKGRLDISIRRKTEEHLKSFNLQLQKQVKEKTAELTGVFERITDGFIALDKNYCFTYVNKRAGELTNRSPESFIGKNILEEFKDSISPAFRSAVIQAMETQEYIQFEEYSPAYNRWFEDHLYPSPQGLSIFYRDISGRKKAEEAIQKSEARYRALIEQASDAIMITDTKGDFIEVNSGFSNLLGYKKEEMVGMNISKVIDPEQLQRDPIRYDLLMAGEAVSRERRMMHKNGTIIEVEANVKMLPDGRLLAIARDITERTKAWKENERIRYLLNERIKELTTLYRAGQILQSKNKPNETILKELVGIIPQGWQYPEVAAARIVIGKSEFTTPNFLDGPHKQNTRFELPGGESCIVEVAYLEDRPGESEGPFLSEERNLINMLAEMLRIYFINRSASEQLLREKNLSDSVINSLPGVFYFYDQNGKFLRWNTRFETVTKYSAEEISQMHPLDFFEGPDKQIIKTKIKEVFEKGSSNVEAFFVAKDKSRVPYYFTGVSIEIDGQPYLLGTGIDITERRKVEDELRVSRENLKRSYEDVRRLASNIENIREEEKIKIAREIHDELGQQLTGLKMDISWLARRLDPGDTSIQSKLKEILQLLDETVKSVRRIASELRPGLLDDLGLIAAIEWQGQEFEKRSGISVSFTFSGSDEAINSRVSTGLFRIFQESLTNVARHARAKQILVTLNVNAHEANLQISDDGVGFDAQEVENKKTLGLLGMNERTMMMGGKYTIASEPGKGTQVMVVVPMSRATAQKLANS
jgi:PAS domain S-box-containing protein